MAPPAYAASGTYLNGDNQTSAVLAIPSGTVANSLLIAVLFLGDVPTALPSCTGWTHVEGSTVVLDNSTDHNMAVMWHRATGSESGTYTFTWTGSPWRAGQMHRYEGAATSGTPFDSPTSTAVSSGGTSTSPSVTITTAGADRLLLHAMSNWSGGTYTAPTGFTKRQQGDFGLETISDKSQAAAGSTGGITGTCTGGGFMSALLAAMIPAGAASNFNPPIRRNPTRGLIMRGRR